MFENPNPVGVDELEEFSGPDETEAEKADYDESEYNDQDNF